MTNRRRRTGLSLVEVLVVIGIIVLLLGLIIPAVQRVRATADGMKCKSNLRQLGLALHAYHADRQKLPPGCTTNAPAEAMPYLGWHARLLPYLDQQPLWRQTEFAYKTDLNFIVTPPHFARETIVPIFLCPLEERKIRADAPTTALTSYLGVSGRNQNTRDGLLYFAGQVRFGDVGDGLSQTLLVGERPPPPRLNVGWWYAGWGMKQNDAAEMILGVAELNTYAGGIPAACPPGPYGFQRTDVFDEKGQFHYWSLHAGGGHFLFGDQSVRFLRYDAAGVLPSLATRDGKELPVTLD